MPEFTDGTEIVHQWTEEHRDLRVLRRGSKFKLQWRRPNTWGDDWISGIFELQAVIRELVRQIEGPQE